MFAVSPIGARSEVSKQTRSSKRSKKSHNTDRSARSKNLDKGRSYGPSQKVRVIARGCRRISSFKDLTIIPEPPQQLCLWYPNSFGCTAQQNRNGTSTPMLGYAQWMLTNNLLVQTVPDYDRGQAVYYEDFMDDETTQRRKKVYYICCTRTDEDGKKWYKLKDRPPDDSEKREVTIDEKDEFDFSDLQAVPDDAVITDGTFVKPQGQ
ncbi:MAG: hypothetical protein Q9209_004795 [Squamulea sp. 1 TL-2023]